VLKHINKFDEEKGTFTAWIYRIARNAVIDHYRQTKPQVHIEDVWGLSDDTDIEFDAHIVIAAAKAKEYLEDLSPEQRDIVIMRIWQELSYKEIAYILGKSEESCRMAYSRGIKKLQRLVPLGTFCLLISRLF
jgi:RNA polymerase sigma-70 factor (ECF subfamily)